MAAIGRFLFTTVVTWSIISQISLNCAYPTDDFFFHDQANKVVRRSVIVDRKPKISNDENILYAIENNEGSGRGVEPDEEIGSGFASGDGEGFSTTIELQLNTKASSGNNKTDELIISGFSTTELGFSSSRGGEDFSTKSTELELELNNQNNLSTTTELLQTYDQDKSENKTDEVFVSGFSLPDSRLDLSTTIELELNNEEDFSTTNEVQVNDNNGSENMTDEVFVSGFSLFDGGKALGTTTELGFSPSSGGEDLSTTSNEFNTAGSIIGSEEDFSTTIESHTKMEEFPVIELTGKTIEEELTTEPFSSIPLPTTKQPPLELVSIEVCGKRYYCPKGSQGPCSANEILVEEKEINDSTEPSHCSALSYYPWKGCVSQVSHDASSLLSARCKLKSTEEPCSGLAPNYRYDPIRKICRPASISTGDWLVYECGDDQFYVGLNSKTRSCRCINEFHLIYNADNKCYHPFTRGPCDKGMWLEPSSRREANCRPSPCTDENEIDGRHFYWKGHFHGPAGCYRTNTRGPCPENSTFVVTDYVLGHVRCRRNWKVSL